MLGKVFKVNEGGLVTIADVPKYLSNELGWSLKSEQERSIVNAIQNPNDFMTMRQKNINVIISDNVSKVYEKALTEFSDMGLPSEMVKTLSMKRAQNAFNEAMEVEELRHPGYGRAIGNIESQREMKENRFDKEAKRTIKENAVAKYKAKKRAKRGAR